MKFINFFFNLLAAGCAYLLIRYYSFYKKYQERDLNKTYEQIKRKRGY